jgi:hypothetical protein
VETFGVKAITIEEKGLNLRLTGEKIKHIGENDLVGIKIYSSGNACGIGKPEISVTEAREKIKKFR